MKYGAVVAVDAGDWGGDPAKPIEQAKNPFLLEMMALIGYDAIAVGERELGYGYDAFKKLADKSKVPILSANLIDKKTGKPAFKPSVVVRKGGTRVGIFALIGPKVDLGAAAEQLTIEDPVATAQTMVTELRKKADVVILLAHLGRVEGEDLAAQVSGMDVVVLAHHPGFVAEGRRVKDAITVASGEQGQNVGVTLATMNGKKVADLSSKTIILMPEVGERSDIAKLAKEFEDRQNAEIRKQQQEQALNQNTSGRPGADQFLGADACASCHKPQHEQWLTTQHAHAFATLERVQKDAMIECVQCHSVGFGKPGGFVNATSSPKLKNVGCETCHGVGTRHDMFANGGGKVAEAVCVTCHNPANDPGWNYAAKLPRVSH